VVGIEAVVVGLILEASVVCLVDNPGTIVVPVAFLDVEASVGVVACSDTVVTLDDSLDVVASVDLVVWIVDSLVEPVVQLAVVEVSMHSQHFVLPT
jgi:hypothetical protein